MKKLIQLATGAMLASAMMMGTTYAAGIKGTWTTPAGWKVKVYKCGGSHCGRVVGGTKSKDSKNPNKALRSRKMVGVRMIWGMKKSGSGYSGKLYNPNDGKTYTGKMSLNNPRSLKLSGCALAGLICKSQTWRK